MKNIVIIGGGTGTFTLLSGLRKFPTNNSVITSTADDGGSTGVLREELGVVPPGDIRQCLLGLSYADDLLRELFNYRFEKGFLRGHVVGNIIISALEKISGNIRVAIEESGKLLNVRGEVVPVTLFPTKLSAILKDGTKIVGEHAIDEPERRSTSPIKELVLSPSGPANPRALQLIKAADVIVLGPGDLFTSTLPSLLISGMAEAIKKSKAMKVIVTNLFTERGETDNFTASTFVDVLEHYLGKGVVRAVIVNTALPPKNILLGYRKKGSYPVKADIEFLTKRGIKVFAEPLIARTVFKKSSADPLQRSKIRHDAQKVAKIIWKLR